MIPLRPAVFALTSALAFFSAPEISPAAPAPAKPVFQLAPAVAVEAEDFTVESGWRVVKNGAGNYMVDIIGFQHLSGERLLSLDSTEIGRAHV